MMVLRSLLLLVFLGGFVACAAAVEIDARGSASGDGRYHTEKHAVVIDGRIDFGVDIGPLSFGGAYRAYDFGESRYNPRGITPIFDIWHRYVEGRSGDLTARGGHYFSTFGRGLILRSFEDPALEHDTSLDGFITEYEPEKAGFTGLAGEASEQVSEMQTNRHRVRGGRVQGRLGSRVSVALSGLDRSATRMDKEITLPDSLTEFADYVVGSEAEAWLGPVSVVGEYAYRDGDYYPRLKQGNLEGHGFYLSGTYNNDWSTLLAEYKNYYRFEHALINPPTGVKDHIWILMNRATHQVDLGDERGFLVEGTLMSGMDLQLTGGASEARTREGDLSHWEMFGQWDNTVPLWGIAAVAGSWSREYTSGKFTEYVTGVIDFEFEAGTLEVLEIELEAQAIEEPSEDKYENYYASLAVYPRPGVTVSASTEATTERGLDRDFWLFGEVRASVTEDLEVALGGGSERGGKKCSGGICFTEPEFVGVRLRFITYF
ncbi:MAG: DUF6029 family protein [Longimicrobiales bacterium]|nr:DUF6029 family protein [Longimicrobiales bacterium]